MNHNAMEPQQKKRKLDPTPWVSDNDDEEESRFTASDQEDDEDPPDVFARVAKRQYMELSRKQVPGAKLDHNMNCKDYVKFLAYAAEPGGKPPIGPEGLLKWAENTVKLRVARQAELFDDFPRAVEAWKVYVGTPVAAYYVFGIRHFYQLMTLVKWDPEEYSVLADTLHEREVRYDYDTKQFLYAKSSVVFLGRGTAPKRNKITFDAQSGQVYILRRTRANRYIPLEKVNTNRVTGFYENYSRGFPPRVNLTAVFGFYNLFEYLGVLPVDMARIVATYADSKIFGLEEQSEIQTKERCKCDSSDSSDGSDEDYPYYSSEEECSEEDEDEDE